MMSQMKILTTEISLPEIEGKSSCNSNRVFFLLNVSLIVLTKALPVDRSLVVTRMGVKLAMRATDQKRAQPVLLRAHLRSSLGSMLKTTLLL